MVSVAGRARAVLVLAGVLGAVLLVVATVLTVIQIRVGTVDRLEGLQTAFSGWDRHGPALVLLAVVAGLMVAGAARGARPAMAAVAALGLVTLAIALASDLPDAGRTGQVGTLYADARAEPGPGFYAETLGGVLLLVCGGGLLLLTGGRRGEARAAADPGPAAPEDRGGRRRRARSR